MARDDGHPRPLLSLVIPCYNEARRITPSLALLRAFVAGWPVGDCEIILVDDGSTDGTAAIIQREGPEFRLLQNERNRGKGFSVRRGVLAAAGQYIFYTDADIPFGLEPIQPFLATLQAGSDLAIGGRDLPDSAVEVKQALLRRLSSWVFTLIVVRFVVPGIPDTQCGFKGFRREAAQAIFSRCRLDRYAFDVEVIYLARRLGLQITRLPVILLHDENSKVRVLQDSLHVLWEMVKLCLYSLLGFYQPGSGRG